MQTRVTDTNTWNKDEHVEHRQALETKTNTWNKDEHLKQRRTDYHLHCETKKNSLPSALWNKEEQITICTVKQRKTVYHLHCETKKNSLPYVVWNKEEHTWFFICFAKWILYWVKYCIQCVQVNFDVWNKASLWYLRVAKEQRWCPHFPMANDELSLVSEFCLIPC